MPTSEPRPPDHRPQETVAPHERKKRRSGSRSIASISSVERQGLYRNPITLIEQLRKQAVTGGVGIGVSLFLHTVIIAVLGFIAFKTHRPQYAEPFVVTWGFPDEMTEAVADSRRKVIVPVDVASIVSHAESVESSPLPSGGTGRSGDVIGVSLGNVAGALSGRNEQSRSFVLERSGTVPDSERAIKAGLGWLARQQASDGHWELHQGYPDAGRPYIKTDTGATSLALLAFLGHGETNRTGEHQKVVLKGLKWLREIQDKSTGNLHDQRQEEGRNAAFYAHSMGTIVLCEALALTGDDQFRSSAELAVKYLIVSQHPDMGGWKYRPLTQRVMSGDISVTAWALMALHSARIAGIAVPPEEFERSSRFLDRVQEQGGALYKYEPDEPASRISAARTAIGLLCRQWLGWPKDYPPMAEGVTYLMGEQHRPLWSGGRRNIFEWYYISQVMHNIGGEDWKKWNSAVGEVVIQNQIITGSTKPGQDIRGSWSPRPEGAGEEYADKAGRLYMTAMCILILETPYRHRPLYE